jgi:glycosyltransferase involved in cell wall biosynthesis
LKILFVHQNFPGQFLHLAPALQERGHEVTVLTDAVNTRQISQKVYRYKFKSRGLTAAQIGIAAGVSKQLERGQAVAQAAAELQSRHAYTPDVIVGNPGWGETLFLKEVWPQAKLIVYAEFYYRPRGLDTDFDPEFQQRTLSGDIWVAARQQPLLLAIDAADRALAPTQWQAGTFPEPYRSRISVIHDGVDTERIQPGDNATAELPGSGRKFKSGDEVLTFINRNLEPYRGYHIFMRALPKVLAERPEAHAVIIGGDDVSYGTRPPEGTTWKQLILDEVKDELDMSRVHFVGKVPYATFVDLMRVSRVHAYLSYPFVLSWSMLEAMAAGALIVGSRTPPIEELIKDGVNGRLVDFFDVEAWSKVLIESLADPASFQHLRTAARQTIVANYDLKSKCLPELIQLVESV